MRKLVSLEGQSQAYGTSLTKSIGTLKDRLPSTHRAINRRLQAYFGHQTPALQVQAPHVPSYLDGGDLEKDAKHSHRGLVSLVIRTFQH